MISTLRERYRQLAPRERSLVLVLGAALLGSVVWLGAWRPASSAWHRLEQRVASQRDDLAAVRSMVAQLQAAGAARAGGGSLLGAAERGAQRAGLGTSLTRLAQQDDGSVEAELTGVPFDALVAWLADLARSDGARLVVLEVRRHPTPGRVDAAVTLAP